MKKRILSMLLALTMLVGMIPATTLTANAATSPAIPNLHRGVLANGENTDYVYWDPVEGAERYNVKVTNGTSTGSFYLTDVNWDMNSPSGKFVIKDGYVVSGSEDYYYAKAGEYKVQITATKKYGSIDQEIASSEISITIKEKEQISQDGTANTVSTTKGKPGEAVKMTVGKSSVADIGTAITQKTLEKANYEVAYVEGVDWLSSSWNKDGKLELVGTIPENCPNGEYIAYVGLKHKDSNTGFIIECTVNVKETLNISEIVFKTPNVIPTYWQIYNANTLLSAPYVLTIDTATGSFTDVNWNKYIDFQHDSEGDRWFHNSLMKYTASGTATDVTKQIHTFTEGKYAIVWDVPLFYEDPDGNDLAFAENVKAYVGSSDYPVDKIEVVSATYIRCYKYYYVYDEKPVINSVKVNGTSVADDGTVTANSGNVTIKTNYDSKLSDALKDYGGSVKQLAAYYLNGEKINVAMITPVDNGDGTATKTYSRTLNPGDELRVESWLEVRWPDGSKDRVDEHTVTVSGPSRQFITQPHYAGDGMQTGENYVEWKLNFTPIKLIARYNLGTAARPNWKEVELDATKSRASFPAISQKYTLYAFYGEGARDFVASDAFSAKDAVDFTPAFTLQPANGVSLGGAYAETTWATNFTPAKLQVLKYSQGYCTGSQNLDVNATTASVKAGGEYYIIRAYYSDSNYVDSNKFTVTDIAYYNAWFYVDDTVLDKVMVLEGDYVERPADPTKEGYTFLGWYTDDGEKYNFAATVTDDVHLTAWFEQITYYVVKFMVDDSEWYSCAVSEGEPVAAPTVPEKDGYTFLGWYTDDGELFDFNTPITGTTYLTAKFETREITDGVTVTKIGDIDYTVSGNVVTVDHEVACKVGYLDGTAYKAITAVANGDGTYSFTAPAGVTEVLLVVKGDVNGDGTVNTGDSGRLNAVNLSKVTLTAEQEFAADANGDGTVNTGDSGRLNAVNLSKTTLTW